MYSFCVEEPKGLVYHLEGLRVPQFGNHCPTLYIQSNFFKQRCGSSSENTVVLEKQHAFGSK